MIAVTGFGITSAAGHGADRLRAALHAGASHGGRVVPDAARDRGATVICESAMAEALAAAAAPQSAHKRFAVGTALGAMHDQSRSVEFEPHVFAERLARRHGIDGDVTAFSATCASALYALDHACIDLELGRADVVVTGGFDTLHRVMEQGFRALGALTDPERDDGLELGEAACFLVLERPVDARERGARIRGIVRASATCADAIHLTAPDPEGRGMLRAIERCLARAEAAIADVERISITAHASPKYAAMYDRVLSELGADHAEISTWEPCVGHVLAATGAFGVAHALLDDAPRATLALTVGFGGQNGATFITPEVGR